MKEIFLKHYYFFFVNYLPDVCGGGRQSALGRGMSTDRSDEIDYLSLSRATGEKN